MSFSTEVKGELCHLPMADPGENRAELAGLLATAAIEKTVLKFATESAFVAGRLRKLSRALYGDGGLTLDFDGERPGGRRRLYRIGCEDAAQVKRICRDCRIGEDGRIAKVPPYFLAHQKHLKAYLRGVFLGSGSITDPKKDYHLEIVHKGASLLESMAAILTGYGMKAKLHRRGGDQVLYLKDSGSIADFLGLIGAHKAMLRLEDLKIVREMRNDVNRQVNCDVANLHKTTTAAQSQIDVIRRIDDAVGIAQLPPDLKQLAALRLENPDYSLKELGEQMDPPMPKSAVNYRLNKLKKMAREI